MGETNDGDTGRSDTPMPAEPESPSAFLAGANRAVRAALIAAAPVAGLVQIGSKAIHGVRAPDTGEAGRAPAEAASTIPVTPRHVEGADTTIGSALGAAASTEGLEPDGTGHSSDESGARKLLNALVNLTVPAKTLAELGSEAVSAALAGPSNQPHIAAKAAVQELADTGLRPATPPIAREAPTDPGRTDESRNFAEAAVQGLMGIASPLVSLTDVGQQAARDAADIVGDLVPARTPAAHDSGPKRGRE